METEDQLYFISNKLPALFCKSLLKVRVINKACLMFCADYFPPSAQGRESKEAPHSARLGTSEHPMATAVGGGQWQDPHQLALPPSLSSMALHSAPVPRAPQPPGSAEQHRQLGLWGAWPGAAAVAGQASTDGLTWERFPGRWGGSGEEQGLSMYRGETGTGNICCCCCQQAHGMHRNMSEHKGHQLSLGVS